MEMGLEGLEASMLISSGSHKALGLCLARIYVLDRQDYYDEEAQAIKRVLAVPF